MKFFAGALTGIVLSVLSLGYVAATTTISYRSTLFEGQRVVIRNGKLDAPAAPAFKQAPAMPVRMVAQVRS